MKKLAIFAMAGMVAAGAWGARHAIKADGLWAAPMEKSGADAPLEWEWVGKIADDNGNPVTGEQTVEVRLYGQEEGGDMLWGRKAPVLLAADGSFSVRLSDALEAVDGTPNTTLKLVLATTACWIECTLDGHATAMAPRAAVAASPYAMFAEVSAGAREDFTAGNSLSVSGTTTAGSLSGGDATSAGAVTVKEGLTVGGDATMGGGLKAGSFTGIGALPVGTIILWFGDTNQAPDGWAFCDGNNGTPDLRGKFAVGAGNQYNVGDTGGAATVTLETKHLPPHSHGYELRDDGNRDAASGADRNDHVWHGDKTVNTGSAGGGGAHENLPPYRALQYIMRVE